MAPGSVAVVTLASKQLGYTQDANGNTKFGDWYGARHSDTSFDTADWCDMFQSWLGFMTGQGDVVGEFAYVPTHMEWFKARGQFGHTPKVGALVFYDWNANGVPNHIGLVVTVLSGGDGRITAIEGNTYTPGRVAERNDRLPSQILGYGYPAYYDTPTVPIVEEDRPCGSLASLTPVALPRGKYKAVGFTCDNGLQAANPVPVRVAIHSASGGWDQIVTASVDSSKGQLLVTFKATDVDGLSIRRADNATVPVSYEVQ
jgi:hypothetical protein